MIQNDIDLLEYENARDPYYFSIQLLHLKKNKKKNIKTLKNSHFKFIIQQDDYVLDQTKQKIPNLFTILKTTSISLNKQALNFFILDIQSCNSEFQLKMYSISQDQVQQIAVMIINTLIYIQIFLEDGKSDFHQTVSICSEYSLQYKVFIGKSKIQLQNGIKNNEGQNFAFKNAFKKKGGEIIQIQNQKTQVKAKQSQDLTKNILRKSLHMNKTILNQVKKKKQQINQRSKQNSRSRSRSSFFSKIGDIFRIKPKDSISKKNIFDSEKSFPISPPTIGPHKFFRPQTKSYYHNLNIQREKQRSRLQKYLNSNFPDKSQLKDNNSYSWLKILKILVFIILFSLVLYYLASPNKKVKFKALGKSDFLNF